jgi:hypothetical protein
MRTLKKQLLWPPSNLEELCQALLASKEQYNEHWLIERRLSITTAEPSRLPCHRSCRVITLAQLSKQFGKWIIQLIKHPV